MRSAKWKNAFMMGSSWIFCLIFATFGVLYNDGYSQSWSINHPQHIMSLTQYSIAQWMRYIELANLIRLNDLTCKPLQSMRNTKCEKCQCDRTGKNINCITEPSIVCEEWKPPYEVRGLPAPGEKGFGCNPRELMPNNFLSCLMCQCGENGITVRCTYGQATVCVPYLFHLNFTNWVDPMKLKIP